MNMPIDLRPYGVEKIVEGKSVSAIDISEKDELLLSLRIDGVSIKIEFKSREELENLVEYITGGVIKL